jgi:itaconyl-CoA hydratase
MQQSSGIAGFDTPIVYGGISFSMVIGLAAQDTGEQVLRELGMDKIRLKSHLYRVPQEEHKIA